MTSSGARYKMNNWFLLPGMGATSAMYNALRHYLDFQINFLNWPTYEGEITYAEIAQRIIGENRIENGDIIEGSSLGGIVSLEIAKIIQPKAVILIGSATDSREIQSLVAALSKFAELTPLSFIQFVAGKHPSLISKMFAEADTAFIRAMCSHLRDWPGGELYAKNAYRLHGENDHVIPCPSGSSLTVLRGAGHLLAITHAKETASFIKNVKEEILRSEENKM